jgi:large repetitive protein
MKRSRKIVGSIFLFLASIATSFSFESGVGFEALLSTNPVAALFDANRTAIEIPSSGTSAASSNESDLANLDPSATFTNNVFCPTPVIAAHTIYVCSGSAFQYKVPAGGVNNDIVPSTTEYIWNVATNGSNNNVTNENAQNIYQQFFGGTTSSSGLINTSNVQQTVVYNVTPRSGTCTGTPFTLTVIVEPPVTVVIGNKTATPICSGETFTVTPTTTGGDIVPANMKYTWTVAANASVTGESAVTTPEASISQTLTNTTNLSSTVIYTVTPRYGTDGTCSGPTFQVSVQVNPRASITTQPLGASACQNGTTPALSVAYTGGTGTPTYQWYSNATNSNTGGTAIASATTATYAPPTTTVGITYYYAQLTFGTTGTCTTVSSNPAKIEVVSVATITTQPEGLQSICVGGTTNPLTVAFAGGTGTAAYQWYSTPTNSNSGGTAIAGATSASFTPPVFTSAGDYYYYSVITLTGSICGSSISSTVAQVRVVADPIISSQPVASQILCQNATPTNLTATISGGIGTTATYQWFRNTTNSNTGGTQITTNGTSATYTPPTTTVGTTYYYVEISQSASGCKAISATATVQVVAPPTISTQPLNGVACQGGTTPDLSVALTGSTGTLSYQWFSNTTNANTGGTAIAGKTSPTFTPSATTIGTLYYYVEVTQSPSGCKIASNTATIQIVAQPAVTTQPADANVCQNGTTPDLTAAYSGGTGTPTYQWFSNTTNLNTGGTALAGKTAATFTPPTTAVGTLYYYVQISFATGGCTTVTSNPAKIEVVAVTLTEVDTSRKNVLCFGDATGNITVRGSGGVKKYTFTITGTDYTGTAISLTSGPVDLELFSFSTLKAGQYVLTLTDQTGCQKSTSSITLTQPTAPLQITNDTSKSITCFGKKDGSISLTVTGGTTPYNIKWAHGPQGATLNNLEKGVYSVVITDAGGCKVEKQFVINEPQALDLSSSVTDALDCEVQNSGAISINPIGGTPPYTYTWSNGSKTQNLADIGPGSYSLELVDANGCRVLKQFTVIRPLPLEATVVQTTVRVCEPRALKSNFKVNVKGGVPPYTVTWSRGTATNAGLIMDTQELGEFIVTVKDARGCIQTKRMEVIEVDPPVPGFEYKSESFDKTTENLVNFDVKFKNLSTGKYKSLSWDFGDTGTSTDSVPTHKYVKEGTYTVVLKLKDLDGCIVSFSKTIVITDYYLKFPNVFTPNKDGINDYYYPKVLYISAVEVFILNKFGELLYESKDLEAKGWDGLYKGELAPIGNYVCKVRYTTLDGRVIDQSSAFYLGR